MTSPGPAHRPDTDRLRELVTTTGEREAVAVTAPFTDREIGTAPACEPADVDRAIEQARAAQRDWAARPVDERAAVLSRVGETVRRHRAELLDLVQLEAGKARYDAFEEWLDVVATADHYATNADRYLGPHDRPSPIPVLTRTTEHHHPRGVVGLIEPWNYPLTLPVSDALPALLAGNGVVLKPALETPFTTLRSLELLRSAGVPADLLQVVTGRGPTLGGRLVAETDFVGFTGSTAAGRDVATQAGETLTPTSLELGGKNPLIVLADADLDRAVTGATRAAFANAGQLCLSIERIYVEREVAERFRDRFVAATRALSLGIGFDYEADVASLSSADQLAKTREHVAEALREGATLLTGGRHRPDVGPYVHEPTVLTDVPAEATMASQETFGPVVSLVTVPDAAAAVERANDTEYGLHASVWTGDPDRGRRLATRVRAGTVAVNDAYVSTWGSTGAPMGGMGDSGIGRRHGREGIQKYTDTQTVAVQRGHPLVVPDWLPTGVATRAVSAGLRLRRWLPGWPP